MRLPKEYEALSLKPDYATVLQRFLAFWEREVIDRPLVQFSLPRPELAQQNNPGGQNARYQVAEDEDAVWLDRNRTNLSNQLFLGDSLPVVCPGFGPAVMPAMYGCPLHINQDGTCWNEPIDIGFDNLDGLVFDWDNTWLQRLHHLTTACLAAGAGHFITGTGNWFTGADCLAAILGSKQLAVALIQEPDWVRQALNRLRLNFECLFLEFQQELSSAGQPGTTWVPLLSNGRYYVITNDFSGMISAPLYQEIFLDEVIRECQFLDHSIYHLDGPEALRHLDTILEVQKLNGIHFVPSPGDASFSRWADTYKRIQNAGKCAIVNCELNEVQTIPHVLKSEGLLLRVSNVTSLEEAEELIKFMGDWPSSTKG
jgi:hypothetical protein